MPACRRKRARCRGMPRSSPGRDGVARRPSMAISRRRASGRSPLPRACAASLRAPLSHTCARGHLLFSCSLFERTAISAAERSALAGSLFFHCIFNAGCRAARSRLPSGEFRGLRREARSRRQPAMKRSHDGNQICESEEVQRYDALFFRCIYSQSTVPITPPRPEPRSAHATPAPASPACRCDRPQGGATHR
jgi:hypothetical protein